MAEADKVEPIIELRTQYALKVSYPFTEIPAFLKDGFTRKMDGWTKSGDNDVV